jgi:hypothetical protein
MRKTPLIVWMLLVPPWAVFLLICYWYFVDARPPLIINYSHPYFLSNPAVDRADAESKQITEVLGGSTVWTYREVCVMRDTTGVLRSRWDAEGFSWTVPEQAFVPSPIGCRNVSYAVIVPTSNPTRSVVYRSVRDYDVNPIKTVSVVAPPIPLTILANK